MFEFIKDNAEVISLDIRDALKDGEKWWNSSPNWWIWFTKPMA